MKHKEEIFNLILNINAKATAINHGVPKEQEEIMKQNIIEELESLITYIKTN